MGTLVAALDGALLLGRAAGEAPNRLRLAILLAIYLAIIVLMGAGIAELSDGVRNLPVGSTILKLEPISAQMALYTGVGAICLLGAARAAQQMLGET